MRLPSIAPSHRPSTCATSVDRASSQSCPSPAGHHGLASTNAPIRSLHPQEWIELLRLQTFSRPLRPEKREGASLRPARYTSLPRLTGEGDQFPVLRAAPIVSLTNSLLPVRRQSPVEPKRQFAPPCN